MTMRCLQPRVGTFLLLALNLGTLGSRWQWPQGQTCSALSPWGVGGAGHCPALACRQSLCACRLCRPRRTHTGGGVSVGTPSLKNPTPLRTASAARSRAPGAGRP